MKKEKVGHPQGRSMSGPCKIRPQPHERRTQASRPATSLEAQVRNLGTGELFVVYKQGGRPKGRKVLATSGMLKELGVPGQVAEMG